MGNLSFWIGKAAAGPRSTLIGTRKESANAPARGLTERRHRLGVDAHLVMNTLNRMVADPLVTGTEQAERIFNLSDYLRLSLTHALPVDINAEQEVLLLKSYLCLAAEFRGWTLHHAVSLSEPARDARLQAHSLSLIAQTIFCAYAPESSGTWAMPLHVDRSEYGFLTIDAAIRPLSLQPPAREQTVDEALRILCVAMSTTTRRWKHDVTGQSESGLAVQVCII